MESLIDKIARTSAGVNRPGRERRGRGAKKKIRALRPKPPRTPRPMPGPSGARQAIETAMRGRAMTRAEVLAAIGADGSRFTYLQGWGELNRMIRRGLVAGELEPPPNRDGRKVYRLTDDLRRSL